MKLENLLKTGKRFIRNGLVAGLISSAIFLSSCGGSSGGKKDADGNPSASTTPSHVVSEGDVSNYSSSDGTIYFSSSTNLNNGDIIASGITSVAPNGFLRKISFMSSDKKIAYTQTETLEDAARETGKEIGIIIKPHYLTSSNLTSSTLAKGFQTQNAGLYDFTAAGSASFLGGNVTATGIISFNSGFSLVMGAGSNLENLSFSANFDQISSLEITALSPLNSFQQTIKIAQYNFTPFVAGYIPTVPPIPIIIKPQIEVNLGFSGSVSPIKTSVAQESNLTLGLEYLYGQWSTNHDFFQSFTYVAPSLSETASVGAKIIPRLNLLFYGITGPYGELGGSLDFNSSNQGWFLYGGLEGKVGIDMTIISDDADFSATILNIKKLLASGGSGGSGDSIITDSDGQTYGTIQIGTKLWMAKNLNYASPNSHCYNENQNNCDIYGRLYNFDAAQIVCPTGWHLPSNSEWDALTDYLGGNPSNAGGKLKETGFTHWNSPNAGATNESGFTALPGGIRYSNGTYGYINQRGYFLSSTEISSTEAYNRVLYSSLSGYSINFGEDDKNNGMSVRCVKNQ